jgi:NAD(P)-dependent dehydrogenase (short-subunit alcohol dehydrogenase family)
LIGSVGSSEARDDSDDLLAYPLASDWIETWIERESDAWEAYYYAKRGVAILAKRLAVEWGPEGLRVNVISPVLVDTEVGRSVLNDEKHGTRAMVEAIPMGRICQPDDIAGAVAFLMSEDASFITGVELRVDGGSTAAGMHTRKEPASQESS